MINLARPTSNESTQARTQLYRLSDRPALHTQRRPPNNSARCETRIMVLQLPSFTDKEFGQSVCKLRRCGTDARVATDVKGCVAPAEAQEAGAAGDGNGVSCAPVPRLWAVTLAEASIESRGAAGSHPHQRKYSAAHYADAKRVGAQDGSERR
jgi:hypothetical protein